ncbi:MAG TPA: hypothetical protein VMH01_01810, partial [Puia sp.]|nr:hypothetical protein [Puia sp.]
FTTMLAFNETKLRDIAKISILVSVVASVVLSYIYFRIIGTVKIVKPVIIPEQELEVQLKLS